LVLLVLLAATARVILGRSVIVWFAESLLLDAVFHVEAVGATALITNVELALALVQTHARQVSGADVAEHILEASIGCVPDFDALRMCRNEGVKHWVVQDAQACILIGQLVIDRLVIVVENERAATNDDSFRRGSHSESADLTQAAVECLSSGVCAHVPDTDHAADI